MKQNASCVFLMPAILERRRLLDQSKVRSKRRRTSMSCQEITEREGAAQRARIGNLRHSARVRSSDLVTRVFIESALLDSSSHQLLHERRWHRFARLKANSAPAGIVIFEFDSELVERRSRIKGAMVGTGT